MASDDIQIRVPSRRGGAASVIHPVESSPASPLPQNADEQGGAVVYREVKHFKTWFSWLVPSFVVVNVVVFAITMCVNNCPKNSLSCFGGFLGRFSFQPFKENPLLGPSSSTLEKMGALDANKVVHRHQGWRLLTCMWLHAGVFHILANMLSLLLIGIRLEQEFGYARIGSLYLISGLGGSLLSALFIKSNISVGASGAIFGLLGGMLSELITNWTIYLNKVATLVTLVLIIGENLDVGILPHVDNFAQLGGFSSGSLPHVDNFAHLGGFSSGFLLGFVFLIRPQFQWVRQRYNRSISTSLSPKFKAYQCVLWVVSLILLIVGFAVGFALLLRGVDLNGKCSWCHYLSCVPTSRWRCNTSPVSCGAVQSGNNYTLTCSNSSSSKSRTYYLIDPNESQIQGLCAQLCR